VNVSKCGSNSKNNNKSSAPPSWQAFVGFKGNFEFVGNFSSKVDAATAYNATASRMYGKQAVLNKNLECKSACKENQAGAHAANAQAK
jgi:hypothetical protein